jgi:hypothetical protein
MVIVALLVKVSPPVSPGRNILGAQESLEGHLAYIVSTG